MITPSFCFSKRRKLMYANFHSCSYVNDNFISSISERFNTKPIILFSILINTQNEVSWSRKYIKNKTHYLKCVMWAHICSHLDVQEVNVFRSTIEVSTSHM